MSSETDGRTAVSCVAHKLRGLDLDLSTLSSFWQLRSLSAIRLSYPTAYSIDQSPRLDKSSIRYSIQHWYKLGTRMHTADRQGEKDQWTMLSSCDIGIGCGELPSNFRE